MHLRSSEDESSMLKERMPETGLSQGPETPIWEGKGLSRTRSHRFGRQKGCLGDTRSNDDFFQPPSAA